MPISTNIIINGDFNAGNTGWSGTDPETSFNEDAYLGNGSPNRVAEMDGVSTLTTVMEQSFTVGSDLTTNLTFRTALRTASLGNAGTEGFVVSVRDSLGNVIATQTYLPTTNSWSNITLPVTFPAGGTYTLSITEIGPNDSLGAIVDDIALLVCFTTGTPIDTDQGPVAVENLRPGMRVWTADHGYQPVRWINSRAVARAEQRADRRLRPIRIAAHAFGPGFPGSTLHVSPQHRICLTGWRAELYYGQPEVLIPAAALVNGTSITVTPPKADVTYVHFLLDGHQIVRAGGVLTESFFPSALSLHGVQRTAREELIALFPDLASVSRLYAQTARPVIRPYEARLVA
ncbi:MAG: Hint domain-containing protein [Paracoccaceae bacterium]